MNLPFNRKIYLHRHGVCCPYCGSTDIEQRGCYDNDDDKDPVCVTTIIYCGECKRSWRNIYALTDVEEI